MAMLGILLIVYGCGEKKSVTLPNPASQYCLEKGGTLSLAKRGDGGQYGICLLEDARQCEEWAMFRGECPLNGVKITGYLTPQGSYCAIQGGKVLDKETNCLLPSGKKCPTQDLYMGTCS